MGCEPNPRTVKKGIYFQKIDSKTINSGNTYQNFKTPIKLEFILQNVDKGDKYRINVKSAENSQSFNTEELVCTSINRTILFNTCYICDYFFERQQYLNISVFKNGEYKGYTNIPLGIIIGSNNSTYNTQVGDKNINLTIRAKSLNDTNSFMDINFSARNIDTNFQEIKNKISYRIAGKTGNIIYQSESINYRGVFDTIRIPLALLEPSFTVTFLDCHQKDIIYKQETPDSFANNNPNSLYLGLVANQSRINIINNSKLIHNFNFIDYLKSGVTIKLTIGIDFTSSNNPPHDPNSLHYLDGGMNDYELAIKACGSIVAYYDYNQSFPVYGFGAIIKGQSGKKANMCFNINFKNNPEIYTIDNVIQEYHHCFERIILAGPTEFCPLVQKVNETIRKENNPLKYHILMILTDGIIVDQQKTIDALVEGSFLPLSVIIIGIGNDHFQEMIQLDGDDIPLISSNGIKRMRDLVQFVPFNRYKNDPKELAAQVLEEVPRQIMEYYTMNNIFPYNLAMSQINKFGFNNPNQNNTGMSQSMYPSARNNYYENNDNTYVDYLQKYSNDTYKNHLDNSKFTKNSRISSIKKKKRNQNYHVVFDDERESGTGTFTGTGSLFY